MLTITREWIDAHRTERGAWTSVQLRAIGVRFPPQKGWIDQVIGKQVNPNAAATFEAGKTLFSKKTRKWHRAQERELLIAMGKEVPPDLMSPPNILPTTERGIRRAEKKAAKRAARAARGLDLAIAIADRSAADALYKKADKLRKKQTAKQVVHQQPAEEYKSGPVVIYRQIEKARHSPHRPKTTVQGVDVATSEFLQTFAWKRIRLEVLRHYGAKCMCCGATPQTGAVMNVDHIKPRKTHPHLALDFDNLQVLCGDCNHGKGNWCDQDFRSFDSEPLDDESAAHMQAITHES